ncbi:MULTISPECIES: plasmid segregation centromere-binding protein ParR [Cyanophyceae]|uniref:Plasmid segregation centromere-binding protein ParR n=1 Tax=Leptolyngbya subtilissima DQ-A4 TaxID=2933933 RepID=A0ABV0K150_9CYAN|nr:plasmid segregation centromere-binding protein ParR [Nodosilinea sp. FACHB-141]MBD2111283.1 plasmid segregation centromere-binding protein ParR [Nodosilinea sp. FACHB-141]
MTSGWHYGFRIRVMVLKWLRQTKKLVLFRQSELDQYLLAAVKAELDRQPGLSFSGLCKEALHQLLLSNHSYPSQTSADKRIESLEVQLLSVEQRFFAQEKNRLERLEAQIQQLALQMTQLGGTVSPVPVSPQPVSDDVHYAEEVEEVPEDPVLARLSGLIDDF